MDACILKQRSAWWLSEKTGHPLPAPRSFNPKVSTGSTPRDTPLGQDGT
jgi:hypothetical protein